MTNINRILGRAAFAATTIAMIVSSYGDADFERKLKESNAKVAEQYPDAMKPGSALNEQIKIEYDHARAEESALLQKPDWPMVLAAKAYERLGGVPGLSPPGNTPVPYPKVAVANTPADSSKPVFRVLSVQSAHHEGDDHGHRELGGKIGGECYYGPKAEYHWEPRYYVGFKVVFSTPLNEEFYKIIGYTKRERIEGKFLVTEYNVPVRKLAHPHWASLIDTNGTRMGETFVYWHAKGGALREYWIPWPEGRDGKLLPRADISKLFLKVEDGVGPLANMAVVGAGPDSALKMKGTMLDRLQGKAANQDKGTTENKTADGTVKFPGFDKLKGTSLDKPPEKSGGVKK